MLLCTKHKIDGKFVKILVTRDTEMELRGTCFRGKVVESAGNFFAWDSCFEMFEDRDFGLIEDLIETAEDLYKKNLRRGSVRFDFGRKVGWESTSPIDKHLPKNLELFSPNKWSTAQKIRLCQTQIKAPKTQYATIAYDIDFRSDSWFITIHTIYPGENIGILEGNITKSEGRVFFDPNHPGE